MSDGFPREWCGNLVDLGIIPEIKYGIMPFKNFEEVSKGEYDESIAEFAKKASDFGKPYMIIPFKEANIERGVYWPHAGDSPKCFKEAWRHAHDIFESKGANKNTIWALNYLGTYSPVARKSLESFYPGDDVVDWIGFTVINRVGLGHAYRSFASLFHYDYAWARRKHPTKPLALFEIGQSNNPSQPRWIRNAYNDIKEKFPAIRMVQWWDSIFRWKELKDNQQFSSNLESIEAMQEIHKDPYFIGVPLPFLDKYRKG